jgi:hypothetical protein
MRDLDPLWVAFLRSVSKGQTHDIRDWMGLQRRFHVAVPGKAKKKGPGPKGAEPPADSTPGFG